MSKPATKQGTLWVMRHGKPDLPPNPSLMTRHEFNRFLEDYDRAGLSSAEELRVQRVRSLLPPLDLVIASDLPRALKTAKAVVEPLPVTPDPVFREIPVRVPEDQHSWFLDRRWPAEVWWHYVRWIWFKNRGPEGRAESIRRIDAALNQLLTTYDARNHRILLVSHAGLLLVMGQRLRERSLASGPRFPNILFGHATCYRWLRSVDPPSDFQP